VLPLGCFLAVVIIAACFTGYAQLGSPNRYVARGKTIEMDHVFNGTFSPTTEKVDWLAEGETGQVKAMHTVY
jgi:hypothetical protein